MFFLLFACSEPKQSDLNEPEIQINPSPSYFGDSLVVEVVTAPEYEEGTLSYQYEWYLDEVLQADLTTDTVDGMLVSGHQSWRVVVGALLEFDETSLTSQAQDEIVISNTPADIEIEPKLSFLSSEDVTLAVSSEDVDGDAIALSYRWVEQNGAEEVGEILSQTETSRGDVWTLEVTANDGYEESQIALENIEIVNSPPVIDSISLPQTVTRAEELYFTIEGSDYDEDVIDVNVAWYVDDTLVQEGVQPLELSVCTEGQEDCCVNEGIPASSCSSVLAPNEFSRDALIRLEVSLNDGIDTSIVEQREVTVSNAAPLVESVSLEPSVVYAASTVQCISSGYLDYDGDTEQSSFVWFLNGQEIAQGASLVLADYGVVHQDELTCVVTPNDGIFDGSPVSVDVIVSNTPAVVPQVSLSPTSATEDDVLTCAASGYSDDDGEIATIEYGWIVDGIDIEISGDTLTGDDFDKNQVVQCYATADDGTELGEATLSDETMTIDNDIPFIAGISVVPTAVTRASTLTCSYIGYSDSDPADTDQTIVEWFSGTTKVGDGPIFDVGASSLERGEYISCSATPFDGFDAGYPFTKTLVIYNALPQISNLQLTPDPAYTNDVFEVQADIVDPDNDSFTVDYAWFVDGVELSNINTPTLDGSIFFNKGQEVYAEIRVTDPFGTKIEETQTVTISNTPPPAPEIELTPQNVYVDDDLLCSVIGQENDEDGDPITYLIEWEQNGIVFSNSSNGVLTGDTIVASHTAFADTWTCNVYSVDDDQAQTLSSVSIDICPLGQFEECAAQSCEDVHQKEYSDPDRNGVPNDGLYWIDPQDTGAYEAYCDMSHDDGGWTMLLSADGTSNYWGNSSANWDTSPIDFTTIDSTNSAHTVYFAPTVPAQEDKHLAPYEHLSTNEIRLCYENLSRCYTFAHNQNISFMTFFTDGISHVEYAYNARGIPDVGDTETELTNYVLGLGGDPYGGMCEWLGINNIESGSAIGYLTSAGDACVGSSAGVFEKVAFGLGLQSCQDGNGCAPGWHSGNLAGQQSQLRVVGSPVLGKFWVFGR